MTGAIVPAGADCVVQVEHTEPTGEATVRCTAENTTDNICRQGEDVRRGDVVLRRGTVLRPQHLAVLAAVGCAQPQVARRPRVGIVATGDELVAPDQTPQWSQIRNSNSLQLIGQAATMGVVPLDYGVAGDTEEALHEVVERAEGDSDVLLLSGGVSMGDYDFVPGVLSRHGIRLLFEKVAVRPGMPTVFGVSDRLFCFGLPGNPVSTFSIFELVVKPFLYRLMGHAFQPVTIPMQLDGDVARRKVDRTSWVPVRRTGPGAVRPVEYHGSGHIHALVEADGLVCLARGVARIEKGSPVDVRLL
jgi:molybdopterin molybdotransferase